MAATCQFLAAATGPGQPVSMMDTSQPAVASGAFAIADEM